MELAIEILQGLTTYRSFSWLDLLADSGGILFYLIALRVKAKAQPDGFKFVLTQSIC